jgi:hypothetical protein
MINNHIEFKITGTISEIIDVNLFNGDQLIRIKTTFHNNSGHTLAKGQKYYSKNLNCIARQKKIPLNQLNKTITVTLNLYTPYIYSDYFLIDKFLIE